MKKSILLFSLFLSINLKAQNPVITSILSEVNIDSLLFKAEEISGARSITLNGVTDTIKSRHKLRPQNELAYRYIIDKFQSYGLQTDSMVFSVTGKNALAIQPGVVYPNQYFIICGHYDSMPNAAISPAADDDGSGCAAVLEAARILSNYQFEYTIVYAIWDEEEQGLVGSNAYATLANTNNDSLLGVLNMDAIAWDGDNDSVAAIHMNANTNSLNLGVTMNSVNTDYNIGLDLMLINPGATYSDHASFWSNGFGAVLLIEDWNFDSNPHYHTATDLVSYFNVPYFEKTSKLAIASIATLAVPVLLNVPENIKPTKFILFPNPASEKITLYSLKNCNANILLYNTDGQLIEQHLLVNHFEKTIDIAQLPEGIYLLYISIEGEKAQLKKLIVKH